MNGGFGVSALWRGVLSVPSVFIAVRWWAWTLIKSLSPEEMLQVRAKVATLESLKGQRTDLGIQRTWEGNYLVSERKWGWGGGVLGVF